MRKLLTVTVLALLVSLSATAQDFPKAEIFGGYQLTRLDGTTLNGWNAALTGNLNHWFGVTGDFSGAYKSESGVDFRNYTYTFGPTIAARGNETFTPFAHALLGGSHASVGFTGLSASDNAFTMIFGGGVDAKFSPHLAFR
ncbi:MAG: outer membrane beta-barrel protein, partial [Terriglobales bacterium]